MLRSWSVVGDEFTHPSDGPADFRTQFVDVHRRRAVPTIGRLPMIVPCSYEPPQLSGDLARQDEVLTELSAVLELGADGAQATRWTYGR